MGCVSLVAPLLEAVQQQAGSLSHRLIEDVPASYMVYPYIRLIQQIVGQCFKATAMPQLPWCYVEEKQISYLFIIQFNIFNGNGLDHFPT